MSSSDGTRVQPSITDLRRAYPAAKAEQNLGKLWRWTLIGPLSFPVAWAASRLGLSANQVTGVSLITALLAGAVTAHGTDGALLGGVVLFNLAYLLDCSDGHLARYRARDLPTGGKAGKFLDDSAAGVFTTALWLGLGTGLYRNPQAAATPQLEQALGLASPALYLFCGALAAVTVLLRWNLGLRFRVTFDASADPANPSAAPRPRSALRRFAWPAYQNLIGIGGILGPLLVVAVALRFIGPMVVFYGLLYAASFVLSGANMARAALVRDRPAG